MRPRCCLRYLTFFGINISSSQSRCSEARNSSLLRLALLLSQNLATINPALHADYAIGRLGFGETVIDVGSQRVQRQPPLQVPLGAGDFVAVQAPADPHLDSLAPEAQRRIHGFAHRPAEADALFELQRDRLGYQLRIELGLVHFLNIDVHIARRALLQVLLQLVDFRALASDDDSGTRRADDDAQLIPGTLDLNRADARRLELVLQLGLELHVFQQQLVVITLHEPTRLPRLGVAEPEPVWMDFLSHKSPSTSNFQQRLSSRR